MARTGARVQPAAVKADDRSNLNECVCGAVTTCGLGCLCVPMTF